MASSRPHHLKRYRKRVEGLLRQPFFWFLTIFGNSVILIGGWVIYSLEKKLQPAAFTFLDSVLWSAGLVTTVGYGDYSPQNAATKFAILALMLLGTLFIWVYMGFFVTGLITPELSALERDVQEVEHEIRELKSETKLMEKK